MTSTGKQRRSAQGAIVVALVAIAIGCASPRVSAEQFVPQQKPVPLSYFGLHIHRLASSTRWPCVPFGSWSLMDAYVNWHHVQPGPDEWDFRRLDMYVSRAHRAGVELLLPLAFTPKWASSRPAEIGPYGPGTAAEPRHIEAWRRFVDKVVRRYRTDITYFQVWDEPNERVFFTGTSDQLLQLYREAHGILKGVNPASRVVSPGFVGRSYAALDRFLRDGGRDLVDVIGYHFYTPVGQADKTLQRPEMMLPAVREVRKVMAANHVGHLPLWNTGMGYWIENGDETPERMAAVDQRWIRLDPDKAAAWVARMMVLGWAFDIERQFWYSWDNQNMGLVEPTSGAMKRAGIAYGEVARWMVGSTVAHCSNDLRPIWVCELHRDDGQSRAWIAWSEVGAAEYHLAPIGPVRDKVSLNGTRTAVAEKTARITLTESPVLLLSDMGGW